MYGLFARKFLKNLSKMEEAIKKQSSSAEISIVREYVCFIVKAFTESFVAMTRTSASEVKRFILQEKAILFQVLCRAGEC